MPLHIRIHFKMLFYLDLLHHLTKLIVASIAESTERKRDGAIFLEQSDSKSLHFTRR